MTKIQTRDYEIFQIEQCQKCFRYQIRHKSNLVFHGIDSKNLPEQLDGILYPKGKPSAKYYQKYIGRRHLHLGPLALCGLFDEKQQNIWFTFDIQTLMQRHFDIKFIDHYYWEHLGFFAHTLPHNIERKYSKKLFVKKYSAGKLTEILIKELDCNISDSVIIQNEDSISDLEKFIKHKKLYRFPDSREIISKYLDHISSPNFLNCECNFENLFLASSTG